MYFIYYLLKKIDWTLRNILVINRLYLVMNESMSISENTYISNIFHLLTSFLICI